MLLNTTKTFILTEESALMEVAKYLRAFLNEASLILLSGSLGSGKTTFCKYLLSLYGLKPGQVKSPTYSLINTFLVADLTINHLDLYRLEKPDPILTEEINQMLLKKPALTLIEWAERIEFSEQFPPDLQIFKVNFTILDNNSRQITIENLPIACEQIIFPVNKK